MPNGWQMERQMTDLMQLMIDFIHLEARARRMEGHARQMDGQCTANGPQWDQMDGKWKAK